MSTDILNFELNDDDREQVKRLAEIAREKLKQCGSNDKGQSPPYFTEEKEILKIHAQAHERAMKYYKTHLDELPKALKQEIKLNAIFTAAMEEGTTEKELRLEAFLKEKGINVDVDEAMKFVKENALKSGVSVDSIAKMASGFLAK